MAEIDLCNRMSEAVRPYGDRVGGRYPLKTITPTAAIVKVALPIVRHVGGSGVVLGY